jgi:serine/threonine-protein kinase HipA
MRKAFVFHNKEKSGELIENDDRTFLFKYDETYFVDPHKKAISLTLPKTQREYYAPVLFPFFFNLIAEGANLSLQGHYLKIDKQDYFGILCATSQFDTIGSITVKLISES